MNSKIWTILLITFISNLSFTAIIPAIYPLAISFNLTDFEASLLLSIYALFQFLATPILGKISDKIGRKPMLLISFLGTFLANLLAFGSVYSVPIFGLGFAITCLFLARSIDGITGGNNSVAQSVLIDITDKSERAKAFGLFGATFGVGFILGPSFVAALQQLNLESYGLKSSSIPFLLSTVLAFFGVLAIALYLPETNPLVIKAKSNDKEKTDQNQAQTLQQNPDSKNPESVILENKTFENKTSKNENYKKKPEIKENLQILDSTKNNSQQNSTLGEDSLKQIIFKSIKESLNSILSGMFKPGVGVFFVINFFSGLAFTLFTFAFQPYFLRVLGVGYPDLANEKTLPIVFATFGLMGILSQLFIKPITDKIGTLTALIISFAIRGVCFLGMVLTNNFFIWAFFSCFMGLINSLPMGLIGTLVSLKSKPEDQGLNTGLSSSYLSISNALGPAIAGLIIVNMDFWNGLKINFLSNNSLPFVLAGLGSMGIAYYLFINRRKLA